MTTAPRITLLAATALFAAACGGQPAAPAPTAASPAQPTTAAAKVPASVPTTAPTGAPAPTQAPSKPAAPAAAVPAGWQTVKHPASADCQIAAPGDWQSMPEQAMALLADKASLGVGPSSTAEGDAVKASFKAQGANFLVDTPGRWVAELATPNATAYYIFWTRGSGGCFATLQLTQAGVQQLGGVARQIAEGAGR